MTFLHPSIIYTLTTIKVEYHTVVVFYVSRILLQTPVHVWKS